MEPVPRGAPVLPAAAGSAAGPAAGSAAGAARRDHVRLRGGRVPGRGGLLAVVVGGGGGVVLLAVAVRPEGRGGGGRALSGVVALLGTCDDL